MSWQAFLYRRPMIQNIQEPFYYGKCPKCFKNILYARLKNGMYYVTGFGVRPSYCNFFRI